MVDFDLVVVVEVVCCVYCFGWLVVLPLLRGLVAFGCVLVVLVLVVGYVAVDDDDMLLDDFLGVKLFDFGVGWQRSPSISMDVFIAVAIFFISII